MLRSGTLPDKGVESVAHYVQALPGLRVESVAKLMPHQWTFESTYVSQTFHYLQINNLERKSKCCEGGGVGWWVGGVWDFETLTFFSPNYLFVNDEMFEER